MISKNITVRCDGWELDLAHRKDKCEVEWGEDLGTIANAKQVIRADGWTVGNDGRVLCPACVAALKSTIST